MKYLVVAGLLVAAVCLRAAGRLLVREIDRIEEMELRCAQCWWQNECAAAGKQLCRSEGNGWEEAPWETI